MDLVVGLGEIHGSLRLGCLGQCGRCFLVPQRRRWLAVVWLGWDLGWTYVELQCHGHFCLAATAQDLIYANIF